MIFPNPLTFWRYLRLRLDFCKTPTCWSLKRFLYDYTSCTVRCFYKTRKLKVDLPEYDRKRKRGQTVYTVSLPNCSLEVTTFPLRSAVFSGFVYTMLFASQRNKISRYVAHTTGMEQIEMSLSFQRHLLFIANGRRIHDN